MNLDQLRSFCEIVDHGLRVSDAAEALFRSQPSITRRIQELERDLGAKLFIRRRNRIMNLTPAGQEIIAIARRILADVDNIRRACEANGMHAEGRLTVATTHTQARYTLPKVIGAFMSAYPRAQLSLRQGTPVQCCEMVVRGQADLAICTEVTQGFDDIVHIPCYRLNRSVITPLRHPLLRVKPLTLAAVGRYPIITYDEAFSGRSIVDRAFSEAGLKPRVVLAAVDADVSKAYVEKGLGIAILATIAFDKKRDANLRRIDARHLFRPSRLDVVVRRYAFLPDYMRAFIRTFAPKLRHADIDNALKGQAAAERREQLPEL